MRDDSESAVSNKALVVGGVLIVAFFVFGGGVLPLEPLGL